VQQKELNNEPSRSVVGKHPIPLPLAWVGSNFNGCKAFRGGDESDGIGFLFKDNDFGGAGNDFFLFPSQLDRLMFRLGINFTPAGLITLISLVDNFMFGS